MGIQDRDYFWEGKNLDGSRNPPSSRAKRVPAARTQKVQAYEPPPPPSPAPLSYVARLAIVLGWIALIAVIGKLFIVPLMP